MKCLFFTSLTKYFLINKKMSFPVSSVHRAQYEIMDQMPGQVNRGNGPSTAFKSILKVAFYSLIAVLY